MKKTLLLLAVAFTLMAGTGRSEMALSPNFSLSVSGKSIQPATATSFQLRSPREAVMTGKGSDFASGLDRAGGASFAQLNGNARSMPFSSVGLLTLVAVGVLFWRAFDVRRAKVLADNEHHINRSRDQMYRSLYKRD